MKRSPKNRAFILILILFFFLAICVSKAKGQDREYYPAQVYLTYTDGRIIEDVWEINYGFDNLNSLVYFNMRPNETEEFTIIHKIYNIADSFDRKDRLVRSEYYLDDLGMLYIRPAYDDPEEPMEVTGFHIRLIETLPYSTRRSDLKCVEFNFFIYF